MEDVFFISTDDVRELEEGAKAIFPKAVVQRCIVHLIRNSIKYVPRRFKMQRTYSKLAPCSQSAKGKSFIPSTH